MAERKLSNLKATHKMNTSSGGHGQLIGNQIIVGCIGHDENP